MTIEHWMLCHCSLFNCRMSFEDRESIRGNLHASDLVRITFYIGRNNNRRQCAAATRGEGPTATGNTAAAQVDLFTTKNFYFDRKYWTDKRYVRCNTQRQLTDMWTNNRVGQWGDCNLD